jgi:hypothetical protein
METGDEGLFATASHMTSRQSALQQAALWPAIVSLKGALLSQWCGAGGPTPDMFSGVVRYLARIPELHLRELEPLLTWGYGVSWGCTCVSCSLFPHGDMG